MNEFLFDLSLIAKWEKKFPSSDLNLFAPSYNDGSNQDEADI